MHHDILVHFGDLQLHPGSGLHSLHLTATVRRHELTGGFLLLQGGSSVAASLCGPPAVLVYELDPCRAVAAPERVDADNMTTVVGAVSDEQLWRVEDMHRGDDFLIDLRMNATLIYQCPTLPAGHAHRPVPRLSPGPVAELEARGWDIHPSCAQSRC